MADLLSPILQAANLAIQCFTSLKDAKDEQKQLRVRIKDCKELIQQLKVQAKSSKKAKDAKCNINALVVPEGPVSRLIVIFEAVVPKIRPGRRRDIAIWPFKKQEVEDLMSAIDDENDLLAPALHISTSRLATKIYQTTKQNKKLLRNLSSRFEEYRSISHRREVLN